ncbi:histidine kinase [Spirosoma taeanense]|uniref:Histidine kinase n=2 Tax=Spirosoma taeanense TaxID=2735870 RepID=A0A6M5YE36_9BACT|nr:histidine kinase [Spirosoma taeanense]
MDIVLRWPPWISLRSRQVYWLLMPCLSVVVTYSLFGPLLTTHIGLFGLALLQAAVVITAMFTVYDPVLRLITRRYPNLSQTPQRVLLNAAFLFLFTSLIEQVVFYAYVQSGLLPAAYGTGQLLSLFVYGRVGNIVTIFLYESLYTMRRWQENLAESEQLKKANLQSQFESLKNQVNPHFLFNSLNSLSSLIADEPDKAEQFVDEMAKVYRYLLQTNQSQLTTLSAELEFVDSYYHLLKTRYQAGIELQVDVAPDYYLYRLPPLTLQMLLENAVKHNIIQANRPLTLEIKTRPAESGSSPEGAAELLVRNNLQRKNTRTLSNQVGLSNIEAKYRLLAQNEPIVGEADGYFSVILPLLTPLNHERADR